MRASPGSAQRSRRLVYESKRLIMDTAMASELNMLAHALDRICERNRRVARLHAQQHARRARRNHRLLPRLSHLRQRRRLEPRRSRRASTRRSRRARRRNPALESLGLRVSPRGRAAERCGRAADAKPSSRRSRSGTRRLGGGAARAAARRDEAPAIHGPGPGQGRRGHRVLPLQRAAVDERGRRRPVGDRGDAGRISRGESPPPGALRAN